MAKGIKSVNKKKQQHEKNDAKGNDDKKPWGERAVFWVGSILAIILSLITLYEKVIEPKDAKLEINFFESVSKELCIYPSVNTAIEQTDTIPFQLKIENKGGKIAKHIKLYISHFSNIELETKYKKEVKRTWNNPNESMLQTSLDLEDLNPGEAFFIPIEVKLAFPKEFQKTLRTREFVPKEGVPKTLSYALNCDLSCETSNSVRQTLYITLGRVEILQKQTENVFWMGYSEEGVKLLKVKDDYPKE